jgi:hypothetical protein
MCEGAEAASRLTRKGEKRKGGKRTRALPFYQLQHFFWSVLVTYLGGIVLIGMALLLLFNQAT